MKNLLPALATAALILLLGACNRPDQQLVDQMETQLDSMQLIKTSLQEMEKSVADLQTKVGQGGDAAAANPEVMPLVQMAAAVAEKHRAMNAQLDDMMAKQQTMLTDYTAGKLKKEDVEGETKSLHGGYTGYPQSMERMSRMIAETSAKYDEVAAKTPAQSNPVTPGVMSPDNGGMRKKM